VTGAPIGLVGENRPVQPADVLTPDAISFLTDLQHEFGPRRVELLTARQERLARLQAGELPDFLPETASVPVSYTQHRAHET
jgi:malate synthase